MLNDPRAVNAGVTRSCETGFAQPGSSLTVDRQRNFDNWLSRDPGEPDRL